MVLISSLVGGQSSVVSALLEVSAPSTSSVDEGDDPDLLMVVVTPIFRTHKFSVDDRFDQRVSSILVSFCKGSQSG